MPMTPKQLAQLREVDAAVNALPYDAVPGAHEPADWWTDDHAADGSYVCRDYVLTKMNMLRALGWPASTLTVVLCWLPDNGGYHAVMAAEAGGETWILDNRATAPYRWDQSPYAYRWDRRQVAGTTNFRDVSTA